MEHTESTVGMLDLIVSPAFSAENGIITAANRGAAQYMIQPGTQVAQMIASGQAEYEAFNSGCLYLQLDLCGQCRGASVTRIDGRDIFVLEDETETDALQALALAARELRTPLSGLLTTVDRLFSTLVTLENDTAQEQMAYINRSLFQMLRLVGNMSDAARYTADESRNMENADICDILQEVFDQAAVLGAQAGVAIRLQNLQQKIYCSVNREMLERAIYNLLSNALRFTPKGGSIQAVVTRHSDRLYLSIQDSGSGIPSDILGSIYSRHLRSPGIEDGKQGIGLGMVLVRAAAAAHGGTVLIQQKEGQGTKIILSFSLATPGGSALRSPVLKIDYAGERHHGLIELSDVLPADVYSVSDIN